MYWYALRNSAARDFDILRRFRNAAAECSTRNGPAASFNSRHIRHDQPWPARWSLPKSASAIVQIRSAV